MNAHKSTASFPLTSEQMALWLTHYADPKSAACTAAQYTDIFAAIDPVPFTAAARETLAATETLRLRFTSCLDGPAQRIVPTTDIGDVLFWHDLSHERAPADAAQRCISAISDKPFDPLAEAPLFAWHVFKLSSQHFIWLQIYHHLIIDATGRNLLLADIASGYARHAFHAGSPAREAPAPGGLMRAMLNGGYDRPDCPEVAKDRAYWTALLANRPAAVSLSSRQAAGGFAARRQNREIPAAAAEALERLGRHGSESLPAVIAAGVAWYIGRMCGQSEVVLGWTVSGRLQPDLRNVPSLLTNQVALRLTLNPSQSIANLIRQAGRQTRLALRHQRFPYETLCRELGVAPRPTGLFATVVNHLPRNEVTQFASAPCHTTNVSRGPVRDMRIGVEAAALGKVTLELDGNADRYTQAEVAAHADRLQGLLLRLAECNPSASLGTLDLLSEAERAQVVTGFNTTEHPVPAGTIPSLFEAQVARSPAATALVFGNQSLTYAALDDNANRLARHLIRYGIGPERLVALALPRSIEMVVTLLAVLKTGAGYLPLDLTLPPQRLGFILSDSGATMLLTVGATRDTLGQDALAQYDAAVPLPPTLCLDDPEVQHRVAAEARHALTDRERLAPLLPDHIVYVLYTSGSTGTPKGVSNTHAGIINRLAWAQDLLSLSPQDRVLQKTPWTFDVSVPEFLHPLLFGAVLVVAPPAIHTEPYQLAAFIERAGITCVHFVPSMLSVFLDAVWPEADLATTAHPLPCLRHVLTSGEALSGSLQNRCLVALGASLWNLYGPTEAAVDVTAWRCTATDKNRAPPIGRPMWNTQVYVLDHTLAPVPIGVTGELYLAGTQLARGYVGRPGLTAERFIACPFGPPGARMYRTGDLARWRHDGALDFLGRVDDQIKLAGVRIEPGEIEVALLALPGIAQACIQPALVGGEPTLAAYIVLATGAAQPAVSWLRAMLRRRLPDIMVPGLFVTLDALPLTANGKLDRRALPPADLASAKGHMRQPQRDMARAPRNAMEARLCGLFEELIGITGVGIDDDFFDLGGHSLLALRLIVRLRQTEDVPADLHTIMDHATPATLAAALQEAACRRAGDATIAGHRFVLTPVRAARGAAPSRGIVVCLPQLGGGCDYVAHIARAALHEYDIWSCRFDLQGREDVTSDAWIECARSLARWMLDSPAFRPAALLGFSVGGYIGWLIDRLLVASGRHGIRLINLDGGALPQQHLDLAARVAPLLPPDEAATEADMLLLFRKTFGASAAPFQTDQNWRRLKCRVMPVACRTIRHLDFLDPRVLAMLETPITGFLSGMPPAAPGSPARRLPTLGGALFEMLDQDPPPAPDALKQFIRQLPDGPVDPDFELALLYLTLASGDAELALQTARRCAATRPDHRNAFYAQVALLSELGRTAEASAIALAWCAGRDDDPVMRKRAMERVHKDLRWDVRFGLYLSGAPMERALDVAAARCGAAQESPPGLLDNPALPQRGEFLIPKPEPIG